MRQVLQTTLLGAGLASLLAASAVAGPMPTGPAVSKAAPSASVAVQWEGRGGWYGDRGYYSYGGGRGYYRGGDNVGSLGYDGRGYGYNRFSGQRYNYCVFDEGYGRVTPCDSGGRR